MISVCILSKNCSATLEATLDSVKSFPEVILLDNGSTDQTLAIAARYPNVQIHTSPFIGFGPLRDRAAELATHDWILALDSDEILSPPLLQELAALPLDAPHTVYSLLRHNYYNGKRIRGCGWGNDRVARLYHRKATHFGPAQVHESLQLQGCRLTPLRSPLLHTPMRTTEEFLAKMQHYSTLFAQQHAGQKKSSFSRALGHGLFAFVKSYLLQRGFLDGTEGFLISLYNANTTFYKYIKLLNR